MSDLTDKVVSLSKEDMSRMHLLEASAGTGKTYSIQTLYLRLVLLEGLTVQQILVVTFTRDATKELRERLQKVLREALNLVDKKNEGAEKRTKTLVGVAVEQRGEDEVRQRLQLALLDFDMAAIYTIHGFCQRVLNRFAFETGQAFDVQPTGDTSDEIDELCRDWWRQHVYPLEEWAAKVLRDSGVFSLASITALAHRLIAKPDATLDGEARGAEAKIQDDLPKLMATFLDEHPPDELETATYPDSHPDVQAAIKIIQGHGVAFREYAANEQWGAAMDALLAAVRFTCGMSHDRREKCATLKDACYTFLEKMPPRVQGRSFTLGDDGSLQSDKCPELESGHTMAIKEAVDALDLGALIRDYEPCSLRQNAGYDGAATLAGHFSSESPAEAKALVDAIKAVAKPKGLFLKDTAQVTVADVNPAFRSLAEDIFARCGHSVLGAALAVKATYRESRPAATTASFDDYLINLREALKSDQNAGSALANVLREEFHAALIDEFQDTDPIQWGIFEELFNDAGVPCFLVGDPKQAIYRFRNGDVETYLAATKSIKTRYPLDANYRSEKRLIDAVNQVFMDSTDPVVKTFGKEIPYAGPLMAQGKKDALRLFPNDRTPFHILLIDPPGGDSSLANNSAATHLAYKATAIEIARILNNKDLKIARERVVPKDIAVLVNKHRQAECIAQELQTLKIPAVRQGTGDVWRDTDEGRTLWVFLEAVLDPRNLSHVRRALLSTWCGLSPESIQLLNDQERVSSSIYGHKKDLGIEDWIAFFEELRETWMTRGYPAMFRRLTAALDLKRRLLGMDDRRGQRRLTNLNHLSELIERKIVEDRKTPAGLLSWVRKQFDKETADGGDEVKLRLETDDDAVRIMTVFTSKGLEFPIVVAPTLFLMRPGRSGDIYEYHDAEKKLHIAMKTGDDIVDKVPKNAEKEEIEREETRQIYVAMTRAVHRTVVVALNHGSKDGKPKKGGEQKLKSTGALNRVLRLPLKMVEEDGEDGEKIEKIVVDMDGVDERFSNVDDVNPAVAVEPYKPPAGDFSRKIEPPEGVTKPPGRPTADTSRGHGSFTSLAPHVQTPTEAPAEPEKPGDESVKDHDRGTGVQPGITVVQKPEGIFAFPAGARTGTCWHEIFEDIAFDAEEKDIRDMVESKLQTYGFLKNEAWQKERIELTTGMVKQTLRTELPGLGKAQPFALSSIGAADRRAEWEFSFASLSGKETSALRQAVSAYEPYKPFTGILGSWDKEIPGGYLTGFVDLLFRDASDRYYILDWKSNRRNGTQGDFTQDGLKQEIALHSYWLQFLLYSVAVHQYLSDVKPDYSYEDHFGGIYYVFLRGVDGKKDADGNTNGVYADRPPKDLLVELSLILGDFS